MPEQPKGRDYRPGCLVAASAVGFLGLSVKGSQRNAIAPSYAHLKKGALDPRVRRPVSLIRSRRNYW